LIREELIVVFEEYIEGIDGRIIILDLETGGNYSGILKYMS